jgi:hypothetical protein
LTQNDLTPFVENTIFIELCLYCSHHCINTVGGYCRCNIAATLTSGCYTGLASKPAVGFLVEPQNQGGGGFLGFGLKTNSFGLVIWASKSPRQFLGLGLKTKQTLVCRLCHKIDGGRSMQDTRRDLAACFACKQVWLGFSSLA